MAVVTPLRFVAGVLGLWIAARVLVLMPAALDQTAEAETAAHPRPAALASYLPPPLLTRPRAPPSSATPRPPRRTARVARIAGKIAVPVERAAASIAIAAFDASMPMAEPRPPSAQRPPAPLVTSPTGIVAATPVASSRWSGGLYVFRRGHRGDAALANGGQLGGSQAGARIAYRLNPAGPTRIALAARVSTPLDDRRGAEAAAGLDWHPLPAAPLRLSVERRVDLGGAGRNAWSAYAAGGVWRELGGGVVADGYAQAGVVGARRGDLFADGALRAGHRRALGADKTLTLGAGLWGAAQPGAARLDVGPRVALGLPLAGAAVTLAAEWRVRVAGQARPGSGIALTLATDF